MVRVQRRRGREQTSSPTKSYIVSRTNSSRTTEICVCGIGKLTCGSPIVHKWSCTDFENDTWITQSIEVNDKDLRALVQQILADVPELNFDVDVLSFEPPFAPFLNKWDEFNAALEAENRRHLKSLLQHLHTIIAPYVIPILERINKAGASQTIDYDLLKSICVPGELIYGSWLREPQAYKITRTEIIWDENDIECLKLDVEYYDWDGQRCGFRETSYTTKKFDDEIPLSKLRFVPFKLLKRPEQVKAPLIERGKTFEKMLGYHFKHYSGTKFVKQANGCMKTGKVQMQKFLLVIKLIYV